MQLNLNSLLKNYGFEERLPIYFFEKKPTRMIKIDPFLMDINKLVLSLHIYNMNYDNEKINNLIFETYFKDKFLNIIKQIQEIFNYLTTKNITLNIKIVTKRMSYNKPLVPLTNEYILFSGGLDSLCGVSELSKIGKPLLIHIITSNRILGVVNNIRRKSYFKNYPIVFMDTRCKALVGGSSNTRGLLFLTFAYTVSSYFDSDTIYFAENGSQMIDVMLSSLAYPNKPATKNTNITFINKFEQMISDYHENKINICLINKNYTKSEILAEHIKKIPYKLSHSCFTTRGRSGMCGICYNCFIRKTSLMAIEIYEQDYEYDPFQKIRSETDTYLMRQRILFQLIRFYYKVISNNKKAISDIELSTKGLIDNSLQISKRFASDIFLGLKNYFDVYQPHNLNGLGKKAKELLSYVDSSIIDERKQVLLDIISKTG